jgi:hypothetical protein
MKKDNFEPDIKLGHCADCIHYRRWFDNTCSRCKHNEEENKNYY